MNTIFRLLLAATLLASSATWACTQPATEIMHSQSIGQQLTLTKLGHYCQAGNRFATATLEEAMSLDWAEYSFQLADENGDIDMASLVGGEERLATFSYINSIALPIIQSEVIGLQFVAKSRSNIYSELHIAQLQGTQLSGIAKVIEPLTQYQAQQRNGSEYRASGFYTTNNGSWLIDSLAPSEEIGACNACQQYQVISWLWQDNQLTEHSRRDYDIDTYAPLAE